MALVVYRYSPIHFGGSSSFILRFSEMVSSMSEWICVEDHLPQDGCEYLVYYIEHCMVCKGVAPRGVGIGSLIMGKHWRLSNQCCMPLVTHWQALPDCPSNIP